MISQFFSLALIVLLAAMLPGADFAMVVKNTVLHSRRSGLLTSLGLGCAMLVHLSYCILGLALIIAESRLLFTLIQYVGAAYLIYLGFCTFLSKSGSKYFSPEEKSRKTVIGDYASFYQGFMCNLLNPKATLFFLTLFTLVLNTDTPLGTQILYALEIFAVATLWFCGLTLILSQRTIKARLERVEQYLPKVLGTCLIIFGLAVALY